MGQVFKQAEVNQKESNTDASKIAELTISLADPINWPKEKAASAVRVTTTVEESKVSSFVYIVLTCF